jgi:predicted secreted protein
MNGNDILVYSGTQLIGCTRSNEIQSGCEALEVSSPSQGSWRAFLTGRKEWSFTVNYLVTNNSALHISGGSGIKDLLQAGNTFTLKVYRRGLSAVALTGDAILTAVKITATRGNLVQGSFTFKGNGALS